MRLTPGCEQAVCPAIIDYVLKTMVKNLVQTIHPVLSEHNHLGICQKLVLFGLGTVPIYRPEPFFHGTCTHFADIHLHMMDFFPFGFESFVFFRKFGFDVFVLDDTQDVK
jgi:hypothetical protein